MHGPRETLSVLEAADRLGVEIWRSARSADLMAVAGLNSERAIRDRLETFRLAFIRAPRSENARAIPVEDLDFARDPTAVIRERVESLLVSCFSDGVPAPATLLDATDDIPRFAVRAYLVQSIGARLGWWTARGGEVRDARIAKALYGELRLIRWTQYRGLIEASEELYRTARWRESARSALEADRLVRTTAALLRASAALTKSGEFCSALWCVRASLLEPRATFESLGVAERAQSLEVRLSLLVESSLPANGPNRADVERSLTQEESILLPTAPEDAKAALLSVAGTPEVRRSHDLRRAPTTIDSARKRSQAAALPELAPRAPLFAPARSTSVLDHPIVADLHLGLVLRRPELAVRVSPSRPSASDEEPTQAIGAHSRAPVSGAAHEETERIRDRVRTSPVST